MNTSPAAGNRQPHTDMKLNLTQSALEVRSDVPRAIELRVSGRRVLTLGAELADSVGDGMIRYRLPPAFSLTLRGTGELAVHSADTGAEIDRFPVRAAVDPDSGLRFTDDSGQAVVLNKWGHHSVTFGDASAEIVTDLLRRTSEVIDRLRQFGVKPWIMGGTLLGPVRSGALLPHDDDADIGYVSAHDHPADVALESYALQRFLEAAGYSVIRYSATQMQILFPEQQGAAFHVDIFGGFYRDEMFMQPFHVRATIPRDTFDQLGEITIDGWAFPAPNPPDRWLEANYGPDWRIPDPGHRFVTPPSAARRFTNWFGTTNQHLHFWEEYNAARVGDSGTHSATARTFLSRVPSDGTIYALGFGNGDDLLFLAGKGHRLIGLDFSRSAVTTVTQRLGAEYPSVELRIHDLGDTRQARGLAIAESGRPGTAHIFSADLLHALTLEAREVLMPMLASLLERGGEWVASFATVPAADLNNDDPSTWHLTVSQFRQLVETEPTLDIRFVEVATTTDRRVATVGVTRRGTPQ